MNYAVEVAITARLDIQRATGWLRDNRSPVAAGRWLASIQRSIRSLSDNPLRHPLAEEGEAFPVEIRQILHGRNPNKYRIIFTVEDQKVVVLYVRHAARGRIEPLMGCCSAGVEIPRGL